MRVLLTSAGLETDGLKDFFIHLVGKEMKSVRALFVPVAAINPGAISVLPKCMNDLLKCGIPETNIVVCDLHQNLDLNELLSFDIVYLCGGDTGYLLRRMNETGFSQTLLHYIHSNGVVLGVSAGSLIFADNLPDNLGLVHTSLHVHCANGDIPGSVCFPLKKELNLTNTRALAVYDPQSDMQVIE